MKAWFLAVSFSLAAFVAAILTLSEVRAMLIIGWSIAVLCLALASGAFFGYLDGGIAGLLAGAGALALIATVLGTIGIFQQVVPYCGDDICTQAECREGCADCGPGDCDNGICESFESCSTSADCACRSDYTCAPARNGSNAQGCAPIVCGDSFCEGGESRITCCRDCGCQDGFACRSNICLFETPRITFVPHLAASSISAATLAANPSLTYEGEPTPIMAIELANSVSVANDVVVAIFLSNITSETFRLGTLPAGSASTILWYLEGPLKTTGITELRETNITVRIAYTDGRGTKHQNSWLYPLNITPRNTIDKFGHLAMFVTPDDVPVTMSTAKRIWDELGDFTPVEDELRFPIYTLEHRHGSQESLALVLASAFMHAGLRTSLVESDYGLFVRVRDGSRNVILDPSLLGERYEDAMVRKPGYAVYDIEQTWNLLNLTPVSANGKY